MVTALTYDPFFAFTPADSLARSEPPASLGTQSDAAVQQITKQTKDYAAQRQLLNTVDLALQSLSQSLNNLVAPDASLSASVQSSAPANVEATAGQGAPFGTYTIDVAQIATGQQNDSAVFSDAAQKGALGQGSVSIQTSNGQQQSFNVDSTTSLNSLAMAVNQANQAGTVAATAAVIGNAQSGFRLQITGTQTGDGAQVTYTDTGTQLNLAANQTQAAQNASFTVGAQNFTSANNTINDAIDGVTLSLLAPTSSEAQLNVSPNTTQLMGDITQVVNNYNAVVQKLGDYGQNTQHQSAGLPVLRDLSQALTHLTDGELHEATGAQLSLQDVGITQNADGTLALDSQQFSSEAAQNPQDVANLLGAGPSASQAGFGQQLQAIAQTYGEPGVGVISQTMQSLIGATQALSLQADQVQAGLSTYQGTLKSQMAEVDDSLALFAGQTLLVKSLLTQSNSALQTFTGGLPTTAALAQAYGPQGIFPPELYPSEVLQAGLSATADIA